MTRILAVFLAVFLAFFFQFAVATRVSAIAKVIVASPCGISNSGDDADSNNNILDHNFERRRSISLLMA